MQFGDMDKKERFFFLSSLFLVAIVFASSVYLYINPPVQVLETRVFDAFESNGKTVIWTYGNGKLTLDKVYDIEVGESYRITYQSRSRNNAEIVLNIEKIS